MKTLPILLVAVLCIGCSKSAPRSFPNLNKGDKVSLAMTSGGPVTGLQFVSEGDSYLVFRFVESGKEVTFRKSEIKAVVNENPGL